MVIDGFDRLSALYAAAPVTDVALAVVCVLAAGAWLASLLRSRQPPPAGIKHSSAVPTAWHLPFIGHIPHIIWGGGLGGFHRVAEAFARKYGSVTRLHVGGQDWFIVTEPDSLKKVLSAAFYKDESYENGVGQLLGLSVLASEGDVHKRQRQFLNPFFRHDSLASYAPAMVKKAASFCDKLQRYTTATTTAQAAFDIDFEFRAVALDVIASIGFGYDARVCETDDAAGMLEDFEVCTKYCMYQGLGFPAVLYPGLKARFVAARQRLWAIAEGIIDGRMAKGVGEDDCDILAGMMRAMLECNDHEWLTKEELRNECMTFLFAGSDTTANALAVLIHTVAQRPDIQAKILDEVDRVWRHRSGDIATTLKALPYIEATFKEVLRLWPSAPLVGRSAKDDTVLGGYLLPKGSKVIAAPWISQRSDLWRDATSFNPDRFMAESLEKTAAFQYMPFVHGPRNCIGQHLATLEAKALLASIYSRFYFTVPEGLRDLQLDLKITLSSKARVCVHARTEFGPGPVPSTGATD